MAQLTAHDLDRIAALAHLELTAEERDLYAEQIAQILAYAEQVHQVDTDGIEPTAHVLAGEPRLRDDEVRPSLPPAESVGGAPDAEPLAALFRVPRVIGG